MRRTEGTCTSCLRSSNQVPCAESGQLFAWHEIKGFYSVDLPEITINSPDIRYCIYNRMFLLGLSSTGKTCDINLDFVYLN
jgi:hypothetical protein